MCYAHVQQYQIFSILPHLMASQRSFFLTPTALCVSHMYSPPHVRHFTEYTTFLIFSLDSLSFALYNPLRFVLHKTHILFQLSIQSFVLRGSNPPHTVFVLFSCLVHSPVAFAYSVPLNASLFFSRFSQLTFLGANVPEQ